jgi:hypothetical protein
MGKTKHSKLNPVPFFQRLVNAYYKKPIEFTSEPPEVNAQGIPITYENKDELTEEDIESAGADK